MPPTPAQILRLVELMGMMFSPAPPGQTSLGREGSDVIYGLKGDDIICGGSGNDVIDAASGSTGFMAMMEMTGSLQEEAMTS